MKSHHFVFEVNMVTRIPANTRITRRSTGRAKAACR